MSFINGGHVYSYSQLEQVNTCPYSYYMQRIEKAEQVQNAFAQQGSLIHNLLDEWAKGEIAQEDLASAYAIRYPQQVTQAWPRVLASKGYADKTYTQGLEYFENFDGFEGYKVLAAEQKFVTEINGRPFTGVVDMILENEETGELVVLDHKSKSLTAFRKAQDEMYRQQLLYSKYVYEKYNKWPDKLMFNLFKEGGMLMERDFDPNEYNQAIDWATNQIEKIENFDMLDWLNTKDGDFFCQNLCSVRNHCSNSKVVYKKKR